MAIQDFEGKRILVTGGGTGLGKAMAERFLAGGASVVICGRRLSVCEETAHELMQRWGGQVTPLSLDVRDAGAVDALVEKVFLDGPLTGLVNNAAGNFISRTEDLTPGGFNAIVDIVMKGSFYMTHAVGKRWISGQLPGTVLSIITTWVKNGGPFVVPSAMAKSAIHGMTMSLASEWGRYGIRLNAIGPGEIPTEGMSKRLTPGDEPGARQKLINPMGRTGTIEELQNLAAFLMGDGCDWLTGQSIMMDGAGHLATGANFFELRHWTDEQWQQARHNIQNQNEQDRSQRAAPTTVNG